MKEIQVLIRSDQASPEELEYIKSNLENIEGWQLTGYETEMDNFHFVVTIERR